jgi:hypothetical protein
MSEEGGGGDGTGNNTRAGGWTLWDNTGAGGWTLWDNTGAGGWTLWDNTGCACRLMHHQRIGVGSRKSCAR